MVEECNAVTDGSGAVSPQERRGHPRYPFTASVEVIEPNSKTRIEGRTADLCCGGCYVDTIISLPVDTAVEMCVTKENRSFKAQAKVAYSVDGMGMGMKFIPPAPDQMRTLEKWIGQLSGQLPPAPERCAVEQPCTESCPHSESFCVLNELIIELRRQGILSDTKCEAFLRQLQLHCNEPAESNTHF
jgi:PilZ domain